MTDGQRTLPVGVFERLVDRELKQRLESLENLHSQVRDLHPEEAQATIGRFVARQVVGALDGRGLDEQLDLATVIQRTISSILDQRVDEIARPPQVLTAVHAPLLPGQTPPEPPLLPLSSSDLLVNAPDEPRLGEILRQELRSADRVDAIVAFVRWAGIRVLRDALHEIRDRGVPVRLITTTYLGATERRAIDYLANLGVEVKVSYDTRSTRLHAKAWVLERDSGYDTAFLGSSNLSRQALLDGLEWNVRLASEHAPDIVRKMSQHFEAYWQDPEFETYDPSRDGARFDEAAGLERSGIAPQLHVVSGIDVRPWPYQEEILEALEVDRVRHGRWRNLVVSPTGTGKTVVAALDYRRLSQLSDSLGAQPSLLFVAHRQEILQQSQATFREVLNDGTFGELLVAGNAPSNWRHVFASIQSLSAARMRDADLDRFDVVVVDEFHHAEAPSYRSLLDRVQPKLLLALTATPERSDGLDVRAWFDGRASFEMRLWDALDQRLLCPFQYFGIGDDVDLSQVSWRRGGYAVEELSNVLTGDDVRVRRVLRQVHDIVTDPQQMRALGFCVSVAHAEFMARAFSDAGIASRAVTGATSQEDRAAAIRDLRSGTVQALFAVDVFNEGFDLPEIDTILFLRPTESATVFLQQLGRGLRIAPDKACLTVLDFIGRQHQEFRFDLRFRAMTGRSRRQVEQDLQDGFPHLPAGCHIGLDRVAREIVLANVRQQLRGTRASLIREVQRLSKEIPALDLATFLRETGLDLEDFYDAAREGWVGLQRAAGLLPPAPDSEPVALARNVGGTLHYDDTERLTYLRHPERIPEALASEGTYNYRLARQVLTTVVGEMPTHQNPAGAAAALLAATEVASELRQLGVLLEDRAWSLARPLPELPDVPIRLHATYTRAEIAEAFGFRARGWQSGVRYVEEQNVDILLVTLRKEEHLFTPTTMYADAFVSRDVFHWESQSKATQASGAGQRYLGRSSTVVLFVRIDRDHPYVSLGVLDLIDAEGERPIKINWRLRNRPPEGFFQQARQIAA